jgi:3'-phosphoadenosine 5'-phosphosulfate sulfotransferase (PAPS reductase)/FAD synthetase
MSPDLSSFDWVCVNSSGGKDSQTALRQVVKACDDAGVPRDRIVVSHQDLGRMEWKGTKELVFLQAAHYGLRVEVSTYRNKDGEALTLLDYVRQRRMWPSSTTRFCTSEFKRGPGGRVLTKLAKERPGKILNVYGFRAEESPARAKKPTFVRNARFSSGSKDVWDWLPIHDWTLRQVWDDIRASGVPWHTAYDSGMPRLSCVYCIFAPKAALELAGRHNPELLDEYVELEDEIQHTFRKDLSLRQVRENVRAGAVPDLKSLTDAWNM